MPKFAKEMCHVFGAHKEKCIHRNKYIPRNGNIGAALAHVCEKNAHIFIEVCRPLRQEHCSWILQK